MAVQKWTLEVIRNGVELFIATHSRMPTAKDFDREDYLPSARQVQRSFNGMASLRDKLGYGKIDFTKGDERKRIATQASIDGIAAEEYLEPLLIAKFGEPYVHTQKRYGRGSKNRYDFFIYAASGCFGVDVFTTSRSEYISTNVRHKINKYKSNAYVDVIFVVLGAYTDQDITRAGEKLAPLKSLPHIKLMHETQFLLHISNLSPLNLPDNFKGIL